MSMSRNAISIVCGVLAAVLLLVGGVLLYARQEIVDPDRFSARAVDALQDDAVRRVAARELVANVLERGSADLATARPLIETAVGVVVTTPPFRRVLRIAARESNRLLLTREEGNLVLDLADATSLIRGPIESVAPQVADRLPDDLSPQLLELRRSSAATTAVEVADRIRFLGLLLPALGLVALVAGVWIAPDRRAGVMRAGIGLGVAAAVLLIALQVGRIQALAAVHGGELVTDDEARAAAAGVWSAYLGDLRTWAILAGAVGFAVAGAAASRVEAEEVGSRLQLVGRRLLVAPRRRGLLLLRGVIVIALGVLFVLEPALALQIVAVALGAALLFFGADEVVDALAPRGRPADEAAEDRQRSRGLKLVGAAGLVAVLAVAGVILLVSGGGGGGDDGAALATKDVTVCNGSPDLCGRRVNEVVFPGTHNSMSAADARGWALANQRYTIRRQLRDGIRLFLIDSHYGVRAPNGRVRTDLEAEGKDRNRINEILDPVQLAAAKRLAGRIGLGGLDPSRREPYLCHSVCELGATPMAGALVEYRRFLDRNPGEVLVLFVEPSITPRDTEAVFRKAGLLHYAAALDRTKPLPTLGQLIRANRRLVVLTERDGGALPWYHDGFDYAQDTPLGAKTAAQFSCDRFRGDPNSPLLMINHWIDEFPPPVSKNGRINGADAIVRRARACERVRGMPLSLIAVDHYDRGSGGGVVEAARRLNAARTTASAEGAREALQAEVQQSEQRGVAAKPAAP